ncbi:LD-carboxypeptidase [Undibacterium terreum]|uniref:Muramoyltetrapeptide carboxypeptidase n=1 Tax=Undibacterium terreum TaxID=1224302 RepID=A0A916UXA8_9BURK|nr:LD-carboxypeptidase [Undibacterium terreum]GGC92971.1 muramoyltetrapeptide carboxypeptidase [Undibacterium terreum]
MNSPLGIAIFAPSSGPLDDSVIQRGLLKLEELGFSVHNYYQPEQRYQRFGASDAQRAAQIHMAAENPDVQIVMALRGGYGLSRLLPELDFQRLAESGKCFVGHSDFTAFQLALLAKTGSASFTGPMLCDDFTRTETSDFTIDSFLNSLRADRHAVSFSSAGGLDIKVTGKLWGSNLAMLTHLIGTPYFPDVEGGILFVEDIAEHPYRVERMMLQLHYAGILQKQKAIVFGDFSGYQLGANDNGYNFDEMLRYLRATIPVPMLTGLPFGHIKDKATLVFGADAELSCVDGQAEIRMPGWPALK